MFKRPGVYEGKEPYIFISYAHRDSELVFSVIDGLQKAGFRVWYDAGIEVGTEWTEYIAQRLNDCNAVIAFVSHHSVASHNCSREINFSIKLRKDPLVVYLEDLELSLGMQMQLDSLQAMYYNRHSNLESFLLELCSSRVLSCCQEKRIVSQAEPDVDIRKCRQMAQAYYSAGKYAEAVKWSQKAAALGDVNAMCFLAESFEKGSGVLKDESEAAKWYQKAAEEGNYLAQYKIGTFYLQGIGVPEDLHQGFDWIQKAVNHPLPCAEALLWMGICYLSGRGIEQDEKVGVQWVLKAAERQCTEAYYALYSCYDEGIGVEKNEEEARKWLWKAADAGDAESQYVVGCIYCYGEGISANIEEAIRWIRKAAEQGHQEAQYRLGTFYEDGKHVPEDKAESVKWFRKAAEQGHAYALRSLLRMGVDL